MTCVSLGMPCLLPHAYMPPYVASKAARTVSASQLPASAEFSHPKAGDAKDHETSAAIFWNHSFAVPQVFSSPFDTSTVMQ